MGEKMGPYRALVGKPEGKRSLGRPRRRWNDNIKIYVKEICWGRCLIGHWIGKRGGLFEHSIGFNTIRGISCLGEELLAFQEGLCFIELLSSENYIHHWFLVTDRNIWSILPHMFVEEWHSSFVFGKFRFQISVRRLAILSDVIVCLSLIPPGIARIFPQSLHHPNAVILLSNYRTPASFNAILYCFSNLPDFLSSSGSGTGSTQPREVS